jgi:hypothetical protein
MKCKAQCRTDDETLMAMPPLTNELGAVHRRVPSSPHIPSLRNA